MTNDVPDRVWVYASNIETWRGVGEWTDDAEPDCSDEWPHAPFLHATPARLHAEELMGALREIASLGRCDFQKVRALLARIEQETTHGKEQASD